MSKRSRLYLFLERNNSILQKLSLIGLSHINKETILSHTLQEKVDRAIESQEKEEAQEKKEGHDHREDLIHLCHKIFKNKEPQVTILIGKDLKTGINPEGIMDQVMK